MKDNFDIHTWNRNRLLESNLGDAELKAKKRVDVVTNQILKDFPNNFTSPLDKSLLRSSVSSAFYELSIPDINESEGEKEYEVEYWENTPDGYDNNYITVKASSEEEALQKAKDSSETRRGKDFTIYTP